MHAVYMQQTPARMLSACVVLFFQGFESIYKVKIIVIKDFVVERLEDLYPEYTKKSIKNSIAMTQKSPDFYVPSASATPLPSTMQE